MLSLVRPVYSLSEKKAVYTGVTNKTILCLQQHNNRLRTH